MGTSNWSSVQRFVHSEITRVSLVMHYVIYFDQQLEQCTEVEAVASVLTAQLRKVGLSSINENLVRKFGGSTQPSNMVGDVLMSYDAVTAPCVSSSGWLAAV